MPFIKEETKSQTKIPGKVIHKILLNGVKIAVELPNTATFPRYFCYLQIVTLYITQSKTKLSLTKTKMPNINSSSLALRRKRLGYEQKQIAILLGHKTTYQISRYETGQRIPSLIEAMKLSILYGLPVRTLFNRYFLQCREDLEKTINKSAAKINPVNAAKADYCSYLTAMNSTKINDRTADKIRHHIKVLVEERSKKILGN